MTPLQWAAFRSKLECVQILVEKGAAVDANPSFGSGTPLRIAAEYGFENIADYLLSKGASKEKAMASIPDYDKSGRALAEAFFGELERIVRQKSEFSATAVATSMDIEKPEALPTTTKGITISGLRKMKPVIQTECERGRFKEDRTYNDGTHSKGTMTYEELSTTDVVYKYVKDPRISGQLRLIDTGIVAKEDIARPTFFISHAWKGRFSKLIDEIFTHAEKNGLPDNTAVWIDVFSVNQRAVCTDLSQAQNQADVASFKDVVQTCVDGTLVVCDFDMCKTFNRAWCLVSDLEHL